MNAPARILERPWTASASDAPPTAVFGPYEVLVQDGDRHGTIVAFCSLGNPPRRIADWEFRGTLARHFPDWQIVVVRDQSRSWFNAEPEAFEAMAAYLEAKVLTGPGTRVVTLGSSVGGFGALLFAPRLGADTCVALSPQVTVDPARTEGSDQRWTSFLQPWPTLPHVAVEPAKDCAYHLLFPALDLLDVWQASLFDAPDLHRYALATHEHNCAAELKRKGALTEILFQTIASPHGRAPVDDAHDAVQRFKDTAKGLLDSLKRDAEAGRSFSDWCAEHDVRTPFDALFLPFWVHARGPALGVEELSAYPDALILTLLRRLPSPALVEAMATRRRAADAADLPEDCAGWFTRWQKWLPSDASLSPVLLSGWHGEEPWGVWSLGVCSQLALPVSLVPGQRYKLRLPMRSPVGAEEVRMRIAGSVGGVACFDGVHAFRSRGEYYVEFTTPGVVAGHLIVTTTVDATVCPLIDHPVYPDNRAYGFGLESVSVGAI